MKYRLIHRFKIRIIDQMMMHYITQSIVFDAGPTTVKRDIETQFVISRLTCKCATQTF